MANKTVWVVNSDREYLSKDYQLIFSTKEKAESWIELQDVAAWGFWELVEYQIDSKSFLDRTPHNRMPLR
jgi:hypothetical protein